MPEVQLHGFDFENWIKKTFFAEFTVSYSHKWDVPAESNSLERLCCINQQSSHFCFSLDFNFVTFRHSQVCHPI